MRRRLGVILAGVILGTVLPVAATASGGDEGGAALRYKDIELAPDIKFYSDFQLDASDPDLANAFHLTRGYLGLKLKVTPWLGARITYDVTTIDDVPGSTDHHTGNDAVTHGGDNKINGSLVARVKYAYVKLGVLPAHLDIRFGVAHTPWMDWMEHIEDTRFLRKIMWEKEYHYPSADFGVVFTGTVGDVLAYHAGVYNGEGYHGLETVGFKDVIGRLTLRPIPHKKGLDGLAFSVYGHAEFPVEDGVETDRRVGGAVTYRMANEVKSVDTAKVAGDKFAVWLQAKHQAHGDPDALVKNLGLSFGARVELPANLFVIGRGDRFDPDLSADDDEYWQAIGALGIRLHHTFHLALNYQGTLPIEGDAQHLIGLHTEFRL